MKDLNDEKNDLFSLEEKEKFKPKVSKIMNSFYDTYFYENSDNIFKNIDKVKLNLMMFNL